MKREGRDKSPEWGKETQRAELENVRENAEVFCYRHPSSRPSYMYVCVCVFEGKIMTGGNKKA